jgi:hypothetical protein
LCFDPALANRAYLEYQGRPEGFPRSIRNPEALHRVEYHPICGVDKWIDTTLSASASAGNTAKTGSAALTAPGTKPGPGLQTLKVITKMRTGAAIWDRHINHHYTVVIGTRSTFSMYNFLGRLLNRQDSEANMLIGPLSEDYDHRILTVIKGQPIGCFVSAVINIGVYCVPIDRAQNTKSAFSILSQFLALKTTTGDLQAPANDPLAADTIGYRFTVTRSGVTEVETVAKSGLCNLLVRISSASRH